MLSSVFYNAIIGGNKMERSARLVLLVSTLAALGSCYPAVGFQEALEGITKMATELMKQNAENTRIVFSNGNTEMKVSGFESVITIGEGPVPPESAVNQDAHAKNELGTEICTKFWRPFLAVSGKTESNDEILQPATTQRVPTEESAEALIESTQPALIESTRPGMLHSRPVESTTQTIAQSEPTEESEYFSPYNPFVELAPLKKLHSVPIETSTQNSSPEPTEVTEFHELQLYPIKDPVFNDDSSPAPMYDGAVW